MPLPQKGLVVLKDFAINNHRGTNSAQFTDSKWKAPKGAFLEFMFYCTQPQSLILSTDSRHKTNIEITASNDWQTMKIDPDQLSNDHGANLGDWSQVGKIELRPQQGADITKVVFANFKWKTK